MKKETLTKAKNKLKKAATIGGIAAASLLPIKSGATSADTHKVTETIEATDTSTVEDNVKFVCFVISLGGVIILYGMGNFYMKYSRKILKAVAKAYNVDEKNIKFISREEFEKMKGAEQIAKVYIDGDGNVMMQTSEFLNMNELMPTKKKSRGLTMKALVEKQKREK